ncbi:hypothetical protein NUK34_08990 [Kerstersia gyiorum]|uniref:hypothetical protein n=1 Tax=Kerstersia gyiorum TaxID=206506 RepID=UPI00214FC1D0|nr:hypothetical protein [Kerstersia gyiorum]MCR4158986.1 hypothetical protein [Kerstersia gyiorum]
MNFKSFGLSFYVTFLVPLFFSIGCFAILGENGVLFCFQVFLSVLLLCLMYVDALRKGAEVFHPLPITLIVMCWVFVLSPVVGVATGEYLAMPPKIIDFDFWFVVISWVYLFCIFVFYIGVKLGNSVTVNVRPRAWNWQRLSWIGWGLLVISFLAQVYVYISFGGVMGYLTTWSESRDEFVGLGKVFIVSEAFPSIFAVLAVATIFRKDLKNKGFWVLFLFLCFFIAKLFFGGFRGSRSNTVWGLFWFAGIVHLYIYKLKLRHFLFGFIFVFSFVSIYSLYKSFGINAFSGEYSLSDTGRYEDTNPLLRIGMNDFSRVGVHSYILHEYLNRSDYQDKFGQTYAMSFAGMLPGLRSVLNFHNKNSAGAELFYGSYVDIGVSDFFNSRVYGLYGEGLLNFGPVLAVVLFLFAGFFIAFINKVTLQYKKNDPRIFLIPFYSNVSFIFLMSDSDNFIFFFMKNGFILLFFIYSCSFLVRKQK